MGLIYRTPIKITHVHSKIKSSPPVIESVTFSLRLALRAVVLKHRCFTDPFWIGRDDGGLRTW